MPQQISPWLTLLLTRYSLEGRYGEDDQEKIRELQLFVNFPWVYYVFLLAHYAQKQAFLKYHVFYHHYQISQFENIIVFGIDNKYIGN